jgi:hypothetical protein
MTTIQYISDTEEIFEASWSIFQYDGAAAFKMPKTSHAPPPSSAKDHRAG